jgi:HlyD family secretion protein
MMNSSANVAARDTGAPARPDAPHAAPTRRFRKRGGPGFWSATALVLVVLGGAAAVFWHSRREAAVTYATVPLDRGTIARAVTASGTVNPVLTVIVGSYVSGVIQDIRCDYNTPVRRGQVCATIDPRPYQMAVDQAQAALGTARAQLVKDVATLAYAQANAGRYERLLAEDSIARDATENAQAVRDAQRAQVALDRASIAQHEAALRAAQVNLGYTQIVSPVDGVVVSRNVTQGQTVAASFQTPTLFLIAQDLTKMQVDTNVSESDIEGQDRDIRVGDPATFTVEAFSGRSFQGRVAQIRKAPQTVQNVVTYDVVVAVDNKDLRLIPGMTATARIITDQRRNVLRAPNAALRYTPGGLESAVQGGQLNARPDQLWLLRDGRPASVSVRTGLADDSFTEITAGAASAGDRVIVGESHAKGRRGGSPPPRF